MKKVLMILALSFILFNCETKVEEDNKYLNGKWTFIEFKKDVYNQYLEVEFTHDHKMKVSSSDDEVLGEMNYSIDRDTITFNNADFVFNKNSGKMEFLGIERSYFLFRIPFNLDTISRDQFNPIYLRENYFLVHLGIIKTDDAIEDLKLIEAVDLNEIIEEEIPINTPSSNKN